jgi:hypothetical protein
MARRQGFRQEVINVCLADLLRARGIVSAPEDVLASPEGRRMPDVMVDFAGLRTAIEGEVSDQADAHEKALSSARARVEQGIAHIGLAVVYPAELRRENYAQLRTAMNASTMDVAVVTEAGPTGFVPCSVDGLAEILRGAVDQLVQENVVQEAVAVIEAGIEQFAGAVGGAPPVVARMADALGIAGLEPGQNLDQDGEAE